MSKHATGSSVLTANRLDDGRVVFLDCDGAWVDSIDAAVVARSADAARALEARGAFDAAQNLVVEPYLVEVQERGGRVSPVRYRERVRVGGPSMLGDVPGYSEGAAARQPHHGGADGEADGNAPRELAAAPAAKPTAAEAA